MLLSGDTQSALLDNLGQELTGTYEVVTTSDGAYMPAAVLELGLDEAYRVFVLSAKALDEPYSGSGNLDGDGTSNSDEYKNTYALGGSPENFAAAAINPENDANVLSASLRFSSR